MRNPVTKLGQSNRGRVRAPHRFHGRQLCPERTQSRRGLLRVQPARAHRLHRRDPGSRDDLRRARALVGKIAIHAVSHVTYTDPDLNGQPEAGEVNVQFARFRLRCA